MCTHQITRFAWVLVVLTSFGCLSLAAREQWIEQRDAQFGYSYSYPEALFSSVAGDGKAGFHYFVASATPGAKFLVGAWENRDGTTPEHFKRWMIANAGGYNDITYQPRGRTWFVLSGYRDDQIYYEKVMFSCRERIVNILAIAYPIAERDQFDGVVERMEDRFTAGQAC
jgi:hypothetical protein